MDLAPSGRKVKFSGISWLQFKEGRIVAGAVFLVEAVVPTAFREDFEQRVAPIF